MSNMLSTIIILVMFGLFKFLLKDQISDETYIILITMLVCTSIVINTDKDK